MAKWYEFTVQKILIQSGVFIFVLSDFSFIEINNHFPVHFELNFGVSDTQSDQKSTELDRCSIAEDADNDSYRFVGLSGRTSKNVVRAKKSKLDDSAGTQYCEASCFEIRNNFAHSPELYSLFPWCDFENGQ
ncbi:MAG: hypothetical protein AXW12_03910 [Thalassospira sp. Nap_22]|nr:MAG: hypothetical protein AXW12_03910 [Thalassospira sp. Nap_22]